MQCCFQNVEILLNADHCRLRMTFSINRAYGGHFYSAGRFSKTKWWTNIYDKIVHGNGAPFV